MQTYLVLTADTAPFLVQAYRKELVRAVAALMLGRDEMPANTVYIRLARDQQARGKDRNGV